MALIAAGGALVLSALPAGAKFWQFELELDRSEIVAGDTVHLEAVVAAYGVEGAASNPEVVPPVDVYRTVDLPTSGPIAGDIQPVGTVAWTHIGEGRYRGEVVLPEPGSYEIVSMGVWNMDLQGYPQPISLTVARATPVGAAVANDFGFPPAWPLVVAAIAITALVGLTRHRKRQGHRLIPN